MEALRQQRLTFPSRREDVEAVSSDAAELLRSRKWLRPLLTLGLPRHHVCTSAPCWPQHFAQWGNITFYNDVKLENISENITV